MSTALNTQHLKLRVSTGQDAGASITAISLANPCVVSVTNTMQPGDVVLINGIAGTTELNGRVCVVQAATSSTITLKGVDASGFHAWISGGKVYEQTMTVVGNCMGFEGFDGQAGEVDVTDFDSTAKEFRLGLQDFGNVNLDLNVNGGDAGQAAMTAAKKAGAPVAFTITLASGEVASWLGLVKSFSASGAPDGVLKGKSNIRITGEVGWWV